MKYAQGLLIAAAFTILLSTSSFAALGGDVSSISADQAQMRAQRRVTQTTAYSIHEMQSSGGTVREFVSPAGKVFGVAWQGQSLPNFQQVLGSYYDQFIQNTPRRRTHGPVTIQLPGLVFQSSGHMRAMMGRAYVPEMVPTNVKVDEIK